MKRLKNETAITHTDRILEHKYYPKIVRLDNESCEYYWKPTTGSGRLFVTIPLKVVRTMNLEVGKTLKVIIEKQSAKDDANQERCDATITFGARALESSRLVKKN